MKIKVIEPAQVGTKYSFLREEEQKKLIGGGEDCLPYSILPVEHPLRNFPRMDLRIHQQIVVLRVVIIIPRKNGVFGGK